MVENLPVAQLAARPDRDVPGPNTTKQECGGGRGCVKRTNVMLSHHSSFHLWHGQREPVRCWTDRNQDMPSCVNSAMTAMPGKSSRRTIGYFTTCCIVRKPHPSSMSKEYHTSFHH
jgi:hypothetical protein